MSSDKLSVSPTKLPFICLFDKGVVSCVTSHAFCTYITWCLPLKKVPTIIVVRAWWISHWRRGKRIDAARREKSKEDQRKRKTEEKRKPTKRILARLQSKKKEEIIKPTGHRTVFVLKNIVPNEGTGSTSNPTEIRVSTFGTSFRINSFKIPHNPQETCRAWQEWFKDFEEETEYFEIKATKHKVSALKIYGRQEIKKLARNLPDIALVENANDYKKLIRTLNNHALPKKNKQYARYTFSKQRQEPGESIVNYTARPREMRKTVNSATRPTIGSSNSWYKQEKHTEEVDTWPVPRRSQPKRRH